MSTCVFGVLAVLAAEQGRGERARIIVWSAFGLLVAAIGWSRLYLGVHHLTDVLAGFALGALVLCAAKTALNNFD
jgi:undecaprenyl-diphosphatase